MFTNILINLIALFLEILSPKGLGNINPGFMQILTELSICTEL